MPKVLLTWPGYDANRRTFTGTLGEADCQLTF